MAAVLKKLFSLYLIFLAVTGVERGLLFTELLFYNLLCKKDSLGDGFPSIESTIPFNIPMFQQKMYKKKYYCFWFETCLKVYLNIIDDA